MKKITTPIILLSLLLSNGSFNKPQSSITGAWHEQKEDEEAVIICTHGYIMVAEFNQINTSFTYGSGGSYTEKKAGQLIVEIEFSSRKKESDRIGTKGAMVYSISGNEMAVTMNDSSKRVVTRVDNGGGDVAGVWRVSASMNNGKMEPAPDGPIRTIKILSGTRFQWVKFNEETNEFIGSGGGTYTFKDGKYTEHIEFYAKDSYKIGTSQSFDATLNKNVWTNKGTQVQEEWTRIEN